MQGMQGTGSPSGKDDDINSEFFTRYALESPPLLNFFFRKYQIVQHTYNYDSQESSCFTKAV